MPLRVTRLALRYGINAFDTSPSYHPSELILGQALQSLRSEYPRSSYKIITKCGKYGPLPEDHVLDEKTVRASVERSLRRFGTDYLDVVYIHDVEYNSSLPIPAGDHALALTDPTIAASYGLAPGDEARVRGQGDERILRALGVLRELKEEGKIRMIGISGYPLPTLLRLSLLYLHSSPFQPLDIIQTYSHQNLQNTALSAYLPHFHAAGVHHIANASPLNMGMLTTRGMPGWHPAMSVPGLVEATERAKRTVREQGGGLKIEDVAVAFGMKELEGAGGEKWRCPVVVGCSDLEQVHQAVSSYITATTASASATASAISLHSLEQSVQDEYKSAGLFNYSWHSGA